jgi:hypothetical protein
LDYTSTGRWIQKVDPWFGSTQRNRIEVYQLEQIASAVNHIHGGPATPKDIKEWAAKSPYTPLNIGECTIQLKEVGCEREKVVLCSPGTKALILAGYGRHSRVAGMLVVESEDLERVSEAVTANSLISSILKGLRSQQTRQEKLYKKTCTIYPIQELGHFLLKILTLDIDYINDPVHRRGMHEIFVKFANGEWERDRIELLTKKPVELINGPVNESVQAHVKWRNDNRLLSVKVYTTSSYEYPNRIVERACVLQQAEYPVLL